MSSESKVKVKVNDFIFEEFFKQDVEVREEAINPKDLKKRETRKKNRKRDSSFSFLSDFLPRESKAWQCYFDYSTLHKQCIMSSEQ